MWAHLLPAGLSLLALDVKAIARRLRRTVLLGGLMALMLLTAYVAVVIGITLMVAREHGAVAAVFIVAAAAVLVTFLLWAILALLDRRDRKETREPRASGETAMLSAVALTLLPVVMKSPVLRSVAMAGAAGFFALKMFGTPPAGRPPRP